MSEPILPAPFESDHHLHVGYVLKHYPRLSETFILNEILGLESSAVEVSVFSLRYATEGKFHPAIASVEAPVHYLAEPTKASFISAIRGLAALRMQRLPDALAFVDRFAPDHRCGLLVQALELAHQASAAGVDHLHAHFLTIAAHTAHLASMFSGIPYSVTAHAKDIYRHTVDWEVAATVASAAEAVITVCDANLAYLAHRLDGSDARLTRVYNGLGRQAPPTPLSGREPELVLAVGRLVEKKGFDLLLDAVAQLRGSRPSLRCVIVGDGDQRAALEDRAVRLGITAMVTFTGAVGQDKVADWLRRAQIMVAPCRVGDDGNQDALPTVLIEALAAGLPAVTTPVAGIPEIITHDVEGLLVECDNVAGLAASMAHLLDHPDVCRRMSDAGPRKLAERFDRACTIPQLISAFRSRELVQ